MRWQCGGNAWSIPYQKPESRIRLVVVARAREADPPDRCEPPPPPEPPPKPDPPPADTHRGCLLTAMGADPVSGLTGPNGRMLGKASDMIEAVRWRDDLGLSEDEQLAVVRDVMATAPGPPSTFRYFGDAIRRLAGAKAAPALTPQATGGKNGRGRSLERRQFDEGTPNMPAASVRARSTSDLIAAIRFPGDDQYILDRTRAVLKLYYEPESSPVERMAVIEEFRRALTGYPRWAVVGAYDGWVAQHSRRPSPSEIVILAQRRVQPLTDEIAARRKAATPADEDRSERITPERAVEIMREMGFGPNEDEGERDATNRAHWSENAPEDDPRWESVRAARAANPIIQQAVNRVAK